MEGLIRQYEPLQVLFRRSSRDESEEDAFINAIELVAHDGEAQREEASSKLMGPARLRMAAYEAHWAKFEVRACQQFEGRAASFRLRFVDQLLRLDESPLLAHCALGIIDQEAFGLDARGKAPLCHGEVALDDRSRSHGGVGDAGGLGAFGQENETAGLSIEPRNDPKIA